MIRIYAHPNAWENRLSQIRHAPKKYGIHFNPYLLLAVLIIILFACQEEISTFTGKLPINAPISSVAGNDVQVTVGPITIRDGTDIGLVIVGQNGPKIYQSAFEAGVAEFNIPANDMVHPGYLALIAILGESRGQTGMIVQPDIAHKKNASLHQFADFSSSEFLPGL